MLLLLAYIKFILSDRGVIVGFVFFVMVRCGVELLDLLSFGVGPICLIC